MAAAFANDETLETQEIRVLIVGAVSGNGGDAAILLATHRAVCCAAPDRRIVLDVVDSNPEMTRRIIAEANEKGARLASQEEVVRLAEKQAKEIIEDARERERETRLGAEDYADEVLANLEVNLEKFLAAVRRGRERLQGRGRDDMQP